MKTSGTFSGVWLLLFFLLLGCKPESEKKPIEIQTSGIYDGISIHINGKPYSGLIDFDEFLKGSDPYPINIVITNNSQYEILNLGIEFANEDVNEYRYIRDDQGNSAYPGVGGNCGTQLAANSSCLIKMEFYSNESKTVAQTLFLNYKNLVKVAREEINFTVYSGAPASLVFEPDQTNFNFGTLTGIAQTPLIERAVPVTGSQLLTIKNAGELRARAMNKYMTQTCASKLTGSCPIGQEDAYVFENVSCGQELRANQTCQVRVQFTNKNQGAVPDLEEVAYNSTVIVDYERDPLANNSALNGYYRTVSANIKAVFESSLSSIIMADPLTVGTRSARSFLIKNVGYHFGYLRRLLIYNPADINNPVFYCVKASTEVLTCYKSADDSLATLADFPFFFKDKQGCMNSTMDRNFPIDTGCLFELNFQPSITYTTNSSFSYKLKFEYDSRFLDNVDIVTHATEDMSFSASSLSAAKIVVDRISFDSVDYPLTDVGVDTIRKTDLGRLALMLPAYYISKPLYFRFRNEGGSAATNISSKDGSNTNIPMDAPLNLGPHSNPYFKTVNVSSGSCATIAAGQTCTITMQFAPIDQANETMVHENMFDYWDAFKSPNNYKAFILTYDDGSLYSDSNLITTVRDVAAKQSSGRVHGTLVTKGMLGMPDVKYKDPGKTSGEKSYAKIMVRNIGTGRIPYFKNRNTPCRGMADCSPSNSTAQLEVIASSAGDMTTYGAIKDCKDVFDWNGTLASPEDDNKYLDKGDACLLTYEARVTNESKQVDTSVAMITGVTELDRMFRMSIDNTMDVWEFPPQMHGAWINFDLEYYDGDVANPAKTGAHAALFGQVFNYDNFGGMGSQVTDLTYRRPPHIFPINPTPYTSALVQRPAIHKPQLLDYLGAPIAGFGAKTLGERWFYGDIATAYNMLTNATTSPGGDSAIYVFKAKDHATTALSGLCPTCDYAIHFGTFISGTSVPLSFRLVTSSAGQSAVPTNITLSNADPQIGLVSAVANVPPAAAGTVVTLNFNPAAMDDGVYTAELNYDFDSTIGLDLVSAPNQTWSMKVLLVAEAQKDYPKLDIDYQLYTVQVNSGSPPTETLEPAKTNLISSVNQDLIGGPASNKVELKMVKLTTINSEAGFVKRRINFTNNTAHNMSGLQLLWKSAASSIVTQTVASIVGFSVSANTCGTTLNSGNSCYIELKYQPPITATALSFVLAMGYELQPNQYTIQNINVSVVPQDPGVMTAPAFAQNTVAVSASGDTDPSAFRLPIGTVTLDHVPYQIRFQNVAIRNSSLELRGSFLKSYHQYLIQHNVGDPYDATNTPPLSYYPGGGDWENISGVQYTPIFLRKYANGNTHILVKASYECFYGENPGGLAHYQKGFVGGLPTPPAECLFDITFNLDINYAGLVINKSVYNSVKDSYFKIPYYSFERVSENYISFFFEGTVKPDLYLKTGDFYDISATEAKVAKFSFDDLDEDNPSVGAISGYRVFYSETKTSLQNVLTTGGTYFPGDFAPNASGIDVTLNAAILPTIARSKAYYFKVLAIRDNPDFTAGRFAGLPTGKYLSEGDLPILRVVIPKTGHLYLHDLNVFLSKSVITNTDGSMKAPQNYSGTLSTCSSQASLSLFDSGVVKTRSYSLMTKPMWDLVKDDSANHSYPSGLDYFAVPHWVAPNAYDIDVVFAAVPGFNPAAEAQDFPASKQFFMRCTDGCPSDRMMVGGFYGNPSAYDYTSYAGNSLPLGHARCSVNVAE